MGGGGGESQVTHMVNCSRIGTGGGNLLSIPWLVHQKRKWLPPAKKYFFFSPFLLRPFCSKGEKKSFKPAWFVQWSHSWTIREAKASGNEQLILYFSARWSRCDDRRSTF